MTSSRATLAAVVLVGTGFLGACAPMTTDDCVEKFKVHAAGTRRAIQTGIGMCDMLGRGEKPLGLEASQSRCVLEGISDVRTDDGLRLLVANCRK